MAYVAIGLLLTIMAGFSAVRYTRSSNACIVQQISLVVACCAFVIAVTSSLLYIKMGGRSLAVPARGMPLHARIPVASPIRDVQGGRGGYAEAANGGVAVGGQGGAAGTGLGGPGGNAKARGANTLAIGGLGGRGGTQLGAPGGDAIADAVEGALSSVTLGGEGGEAPQADGRGGRGGRSGLQLLGISVRLPDGSLAGAGGRGANTPFYDGKLETIKRIYREYLQLHSGQPVEPIHGINSNALLWINQRLRQMNVTWRCRITDGEYEFYAADRRSEAPIGR